jgi:hypothetical protein
MGGAAAAAHAASSSSAAAVNAQAAHDAEARKILSGLRQAGIEPALLFHSASAQKQ